MAAPAPGAADPCHTSKALCSKACKRSGFVVVIGGGTDGLSLKFRVDGPNKPEKCCCCCENGFVIIGVAGTSPYLEYCLSTYRGALRDAAAAGSTGATPSTTSGC